MQTRARVKAHDELIRRTATRRVRLKRNTTPPIPWEPLVPTLLSIMLTEFDRRLHTQCRDNVSHFLNACVLLCRESHDMVISHPSAKYVLFYERWRCHGPQNCSYFLEMWPHFVPLDGPSQGAAVSDTNAVRRLDVRAAVADRVSCVSALELESTNLDMVRTRFYAPDLPAGVPLCVKIFVGRARFMFDAIKEEHSCDDQEVFSPCRVCGRDCFFRWHTTDESCDEDDDTEMSPRLGSVESQREYWRLCGGQQPLMERHQSRCCTIECELKMQKEINVAMGVTADELLKFDAPLHKEGTGRVPSAFRAALKRNALAGRRMRSTEDYVYNVLNREEVGQLRSMSNTMLNVDLALLYAAAHISESPALLAGRVVPPLTRDWRSVPTMCRNAIVSCRALYNNYRPIETTPIANFAVRPKFLSKSRDHASSFF